MVIQIGVLCKWTNDAQRLLLGHFDTIHNSPSHIYHSSLPFSPSSSWLHKCYDTEFLQEVKVVKGVPSEWGKYSHTVSLDSCTLDLSYWNNTIAVGSRNGVITILNMTTGNRMTALSGHMDGVNTLTFSLDGKSLISGGDDKTVKLWDMQTGGIVKTFSGHTGSIQSVSISPDFTIASGSKDSSICLWDSQTGECHCVIKQQSPVQHVSFSPTDPQHLLSVCNDKVWQWDINGHRVGPTYYGSHIAFSSDGTQFAVCNGTAVKVQKVSSGEVVTEFHVANRNTSYCCFSPDNRFIAVAAGRTAYTWDITCLKPCLIETFIGHADVITFLAFSSLSSLISASNDGSIKFWQIGTPSTDPAMTDSKSEIRSVTLQAKAGIVITSDSDGMVKTWDISTGHCKASFQTPAKGIYKRDVQLINGKLIIVWCTVKKINIWDTEEGELLLEVDGVSSWLLEDLKISGDGSRFFSLDGTLIQVWSIWTGEFMGKVKINPSLWTGSFIVDGSRVWTQHIDSGYQGWEFGTPGSLPVQLPSIPPGGFHPNSVVLWDTGLSQLRDKVTAKVVFQLPKRLGKPVNVQWDNQYLAASFKSTELLILDYSHMLLQ